ncbi:MAG: hypothetical protein HQK91_08205 [Nitrospirae bacterium]|nr:hypothetical protein [Nitrospirota bacterium]
MEPINEKISVLALFGDKEKLRPYRFKWGNRIFNIKDVTYSWVDTLGSAKIYHFAVTDGATVFELGFNSLSMVWRLERTDA